MRTRPTVVVLDADTASRASISQTATQAGLIVLASETIGVDAGHIVSEHRPAAALVRSSAARIALVDLSARFGDVALTYDIGPNRTLADAARDIDNLTFTTISNYMTPHPSGVLLLPASRSPEDWEAIKPEPV